MTRAWVGPPRRTPARRRSVVAIGVFDGLHRGHREILNLVIREARRLHAVPAVVTFDRHPLETLRPSRAPRMIMSLPQRLAALRSAGVTRIEVLKFDRLCAAMTATDFLEAFLWRRLRPAAVVVGPNFVFGRGGRGNVALFRRWGRVHGVTVLPVRQARGGRPLWPASHKGRPAVISSSLIRRLLSRGDVSGAHRLLGHPMEIAGRVIHGAHRGRGWGIPTANLSPETRYALPPGVYAGSAVTNGRWTRAVINIGRRPTIRVSSPWKGEGQGEGLVVEIHLIGTRRNLYGRRLRVRLLKRLRAEKKFASPEALINQIRRDIARAICPPFTWGAEICDNPGQEKRGEAKHKNE